MAFFYTNTRLGGCLDIYLQENQTKDLVFSFHAAAGLLPLGHLKNKSCTKLAGKKSWYNAIRKPENKSFNTAYRLQFV